MNLWQSFLKKKGIKEEDFNNLDGEQKGSLYQEHVGESLAELNKGVKAVSDQLEDRPSESDLNKLRDEIGEKHNKMLDVLKEYMTEIKKGVSGSTVAAIETVKSQLNTEESRKQLQAIKAGNGEHIKINLSAVKAPATMTIAGNTAPTDTIPQPLREAGMNRIADRPNFVAANIVNSTTSLPVIEWVEQVNRDGGAGQTAENAPKNQADFDLQTVSTKVKKTTMFIKVSMEMLEDVDFIESEIRNELMILVGLQVDSQLLIGDGTGTNLTGLDFYATPYSAGTFAGTIDEANNWDVLQTGINQIILANFYPTRIFMNPSDVTSMKLTKGTDGHYVLPPFTSANGLVVDNIPIIWNNGVAQDDFYIFDGMKATVFTRKSMTIDIGLSGDDFTNNRVTILAEWRGALRVKGNDTGAIVTGTFSAAKTALETV